MNILVTGSSGFVGYHLVQKLVEKKHSVSCLKRGDLLSNFKSIDIIINCAAELDDSSKMVESNFILTHNLLEYCRINKVSKFIQIGSSSETGPLEGKRSETSFCHPTNLYEATKLAATNLCIGYAEQYDIDISIARPFTLYGANDKSRKMLPKLFECLNKKQTFKCFLGGHDWIHVDDFVDGIFYLINSPRSLTKAQIYHFGTGKNTSNKEIVEKFVAIAGGPNYEIINDKYRSYDVLDWRADISKARQNLSWQPRTDIDNGLKKFIYEQKKYV